MRFPRGTARATAQAVLAVQAEYAGWELDRVRIWPDGTHLVVMRRPRRVPGEGRERVESPSRRLREA